MDIKRAIVLTEYGDINLFCSSELLFLPRFALSNVISTYYRGWSIWWHMKAELSFLVDATNNRVSPMLSSLEPSQATYVKICAQKN